MLDIGKKTEGDKLTVSLDGRVDTMTAQVLAKELEASINGVKELVIDLEKLTYISSAGLRILMSAQKAMDEQKGTLKVVNANDSVMDIFETTGFTAVLTIE